jgi:hypothetical protein
VTESLAGEAQKAPLGRAVEEDLRHRQGDELGVRDPGLAARALPPWQEIVGQHIKCGEKGVEVGEHGASLVDVALATPSFGALRAASSQRDGDLESLI